MQSQLNEFAQQFCATQPSKPIDGEYYELPGVTVYHTATLALPEKGRIEVNCLTADAPASFEWQYEITINDKVDGAFIHVLLRPDGSVVETYGKTVLPVDADRGAELLTKLQQLSAPTA